MLVETDFLASGKHFFPHFQTLLPLIAFQSPAFWLVKADSLASVNHYFIYFPDIGNVFLQQILRSGQWKQVAWLVETIFFFRYSWQLKLFSAQCKFIITTNPSFWLVETDFLFNDNDIHSVIFSLKPLLPLERDQYLKNSYLY